ncbi:MAG: hypothetical protein U5K84_07330 [Alkalibacterium sp.]|nr:hypothetical protein [Alkalibacterium sp.]
MRLFSLDAQAHGLFDNQLNEALDLNTAIHERQGHYDQELLSSFIQSLRLNP